MRDRPSPNHNERPPGTAIDMLIIHYTGMATAEDALQRMTDPVAKVSAHYCIDEDGEICRLVPEERRAWHAGVAWWGGVTDINGCSLGIELVNPGHEWGYRPFPAAQMESLVGLAGDIVRRHAISRARVLGHSDVAPERKQDPGELFDWRALARAGIGLWPPELDIASSDAASETSDAHAMLTRLGYGPPELPTETLVLAFQRHYAPRCLSGHADSETLRRMRVLLDARAGAP